MKCVDKTIFCSFLSALSLDLHPPLSRCLFWTHRIFYSASCPSNQTGTQWQLIGCGSRNKELLCLGPGHVSKHNLACLWVQLPHIVRRQVCELPFRSPLLPGPGTLSPLTPYTPSLRPEISPKAPSLHWKACPCPIPIIMSEISSFLLLFIYDL